MDTIKITYDNIGNTLDIWFTKPSKNIICDDLDNDTIVKRDIKGKIVGIEILNYISNKKESVDSIPLELSLVGKK
ncbi:MAG: DUF2283 domain-containing protein [Bacteroidetes bacterium]|nr:DUF2283 domain-containing protein [Bacteroidota bacterium]